MSTVFQGSLPANSTLWTTAMDYVRYPRHYFLERSIALEFSTMFWAPLKNTHPAQVYSVARRRWRPCQTGNFTKWRRNYLDGQITLGWKYLVFWVNCEEGTCTPPKRKGESQAIVITVTTVGTFFRLHLWSPCRRASSSCRCHWGVSKPCPSPRQTPPRWRSGQRSLTWEMRKGPMDR